MKQSNLRMLGMLCALCAFAVLVAADDNSHSGEMEDNEGKVHRRQARNKPMLVRLGKRPKPAFVRLGRAQRSQYFEDEDEYERPARNKPALIRLG